MTAVRLLTSDMSTELILCRKSKFSRYFRPSAVDIVFLFQVQRQALQPHLQAVQQHPVRMCQQQAKVLSSSKAHTLWGNPRNHQKDLRGILQGTLIMTTWTPAETLQRTFHTLVVAASGQEVKLLVMGQVGALFNK